MLTRGWASKSTRPPASTCFAPIRTVPRKSGLLEIVERQQAALTAERAALKRERDALAAEAKALGLSLRTEVRSAVTDGLATAATDSVQAV